MDEHTSDHISTPVPQGAELAQRRKAATIFVVEDDEAGRDALQAWLVAHDFRAPAYDSAEQFLHEADLTAAGCVITDFRMPGLSGTDLQVELSQRKSILPVIMVSGYANVPVAVRAMRQGAVTLLEKPYDNAELLQAIDEALQQNANVRAQLENAAQVQQRIAQLSDTQRQVMHLLVAGQANKSIATQLDIGLRTVERHRHHVLETMQVNSLPELASLLAGIGESATSTGC